jgi:hypothetical protein
MDAWMTWANKAGSAIVDHGSPLNAGEDPNSGDPIGGYSILEAADPAALQQVLAGHPHTEMGGTIAVYELLPVPGS